MKRVNLLFSVVVTTGFMLFGAKAAFAADDCTRLGGAINGALECEVSTSVTRSDLTAPGGPYTIAETLRITSTGHVTIPSNTTANSLTLNITGKFIMADGASINGDTSPLSGGASSTQQGATIAITASGDITLAGDLGNGGARITAEMQAGSCNGDGRGGNITLVSNGGNVNTDDGSVISTNSTKCPAGDIVITATPTGKIDIDGWVLAQSVSSGTGSGKAGGGRITVIAGCDLTISDTGIVSSQGKDQGADLVHLQGCKVVVHGLVESAAVQGGGHSDGVDNACNTDLLNHRYPGHANYFTGCVEIWSGTTIEIKNTAAGNNGEVSVDGIVANSSWIDLFANGNITLVGENGYAVHGNPTGATNNSAALITIKSAGGNVSTSGMAIQANALGGGSAGGVVIVQAFADVLFGSASVQAEGPNSGTDPFGGEISGRAFNGSLTGTAPGELNADGGTAGGGKPIPGTVLLEACANDPGPGYTGAVTGGETDHGPGVPYCGGAPFIPATLPPASCPTNCGNLPGGKDCEKAAVRSVLNTDTGRFPGNAGPDLIFRLDLGVDGAGNTSIQQSITNVTDTNGDGYLIVLVLKDGTGTLGGSTSQKVDISLNYPKTFALFGCSVTLIDPDKKDGLPTGLIEASANSPNHVAPPAPGNIFVMDLHGTGSDVAGWYVVGDGRYMRNVATSNNAIGMWLQGNNNTMHNGNGNNNVGAGIYVQGNGNIVDSSDALGNGGAGVAVLGNNNKVLKVDAGDKGKGNGGDGVNVNGTGNTIQEVDAFANGGNGIAVTGGTNKLLKNNVGDAKKGNVKDGIVVAGNGNTLQENDAYANGGNGIKATGTGNSFSKNVAGDRGDKANSLDGFLLSGGSSVVENTAVGNKGNGFHLTSSGFSLTKNVSGGTGSGTPNALCQYKFDVAGNVNAGSNKSNNVTLVGTPFAAGCK